MKSNNVLNLTLKFTSLQALISLADKLQIHKGITNQNNSPLYLPYILSQGIVDCIRKIKPDLQQRKAINYTKNVSLGIGIITSAFMTVGFNGVDYILNFSLTLLKTSATTLIIDKLNRLKTIDGVSVTILINFLLTLPNMIINLSTKPLIITLLFIASISTMIYGNYKLLQNTEDIRMHYKDKIDKFSLSTRNTYTTSLTMSSFITSLMPVNPLFQNGLLFIINPLIQWILSNNSVDIDGLDKYLQHNDIYIDELKHGKDTKDLIKQMIKHNSVKLGLIGALMFILSSLLIKVFAISISPIMLSVLANSFINVNFGIKSLIKSNKYSNFKILGSSII